MSTGTSRLDTNTTTTTTERLTTATTTPRRRNSTVQQQQQHLRDDNNNNNTWNDHSFGTIDRELEDAESRLFFVFPELQDRFQRGANYRITTTETMDASAWQQQQRQTGVLWKRRDVFKNRWRPRWFALNPSQGVLTYYLLSSPEATHHHVTTFTSNTMISTPPSSIPSFHSMITASTPHRNRATSWDSIVSGVSENTVDYDVVPRGTIFLIGCTVEINDALTRTSEHLYAFTIQPPKNKSSDTGTIHLAARTAEHRSVWVDKIKRVCQVAVNNNNNNNTLPPHLQTPSQLLLNRQHSIPEGEFEDESCQVVMNHDHLHETLSTEPVTGEQEAEVVWKSLSSNADLFHNVPSSLAESIQKKLSDHLNLLLLNNHGPNNPNGNGSSDSEVQWKRLFHHDNGHSAYQRIDSSNEGRGMIKSLAILNHPPKQILNLLVDIARRPEVESNMRVAERLQIINPHTFLDYYAYHAVWPTQAREFAIVTHWQTVTLPRHHQHDDERAIVMLSFSCPQADFLKPITPKHVRANLLVSMYLLRPIHSNHHGEDEERCHMTRLLLFDLSGGVSRQLSNVISTQQANIPVIIRDFLDRHESIIENRFRGQLSDEAIICNVIERLTSMVQGAAHGTMPSPPAPRRQIAFDESRMEDDDSGNISIISGTNGETRMREQQPSALRQAMVLMAPVIFHGIANCMRISGLNLLFVPFAFLALRLVACWQIGCAIEQPDTRLKLGTVTCRFHLDLKGILRFIANKREEREEMKTGAAEVSVVHIVTSALALALKKEPELRMRRVSIPWLLIDRWVDISSEPIDVSISKKSGNLLTLYAVDSENVQNIADELAEAEKKPLDRVIGECVVMSTPGTDELEMEVAPDFTDTSILAVIGGVRMKSIDQRHPGASRSSPAPRPVLTITLTMNGHLGGDLATYRRLADEVKRFLEFPEILD